MKKILSFIFLGAALLTIAACSDETEYKVTYPPEITLSPSSVTLSSEAVDYTVNYSVSNPVDGATVALTSDASWVSDLDTPASGQVSFSVSQNSSEDLRTANLTLTYSYDDGSVTAKIAVVQYGINGPVLSVDPNAVVAEAEGGEYSFGYSVENPIDGESVECSTTATWLSGFAAADGKVSFTIAANDEGELRTGTITVSYSGLEKEVTVVQEYALSDGVIITVDPNAFVVDTDGGDFSFTYTVKGVVSGETVKCVTEQEDWITGIKDNNGTVSFTVAAMTEHELRTGFITVTYGEYSKEVEIVQDRLNDPSLSLSITSLKAEGEGGTYSFEYDLKNPYVGEELKCEADVEWITDFKDDGEGTVTFTIAQSDQDDKRTGTITVSYHEIEKTISVQQKHKPDSNNWTQYGTGKFQYVGIIYEVALSNDLTIYQNSDNQSRFKIEKWGGGKDLLFTWDQTTNEVLLDEDQYTGTDSSSYGEIYIMDLSEYGDEDGPYFPEIGEAGCPYGFYEDGVFYFAIIYYCDAGYFGFGYETFTLSTASAHKTLEEVVGTYSFKEWSAADGTFSTATYVLAASDDTGHNIMFTTFDDTAITPGTSSGSGPNAGSVTYTYIYGNYDEETGILDFDLEQMYSSTRSGMTTYYLGFKTYYDDPAEFLVFNNGVIWGPFYADYIEEGAYSLSSSGGPGGGSSSLSYQGAWQAFIYMYGTQSASSSPSNLSSRSGYGVRRLSKDAVKGTRLDFITKVKAGK